MNLVEKFIGIMKTCRNCGAKWRLNYPFGRKSRGSVTMIVEHKKGCRYGKHSEMEY